MFLVFIFIVSLALVHSRSFNVLYLDTEGIQNSLRFQEREVYVEEFPCFESNVSGWRQLVSFAVVLHNSGPDDIFLGPYLSYLQLKWELWDASEKLSYGFINITCVRDNRGPALSLKYFTCLYGGMSPTTYMYLNEHTTCQWIDFTDLSLTDEYHLSLQLQPSATGLGEGKLDTEVVWLTFVPSHLDPLVLASLSRSILFMLGFSLPFAVYFVIVLVMAAKHQSLVIKFKTFKEHTN